MKELTAAAPADRVSRSSVTESERKLTGVLWGFLTAGALFTAVNLQWPILRNALCYAKAALGIVAHHFNLLAIAHDHAWTSGKPILFAAVAAPFVSVFGANIGTVLASAVGTALFLGLVTLALPRLNRRGGLDPQLAPLELVLVAFNPLVIYQFWSAYPDSLFAGLVVLAFILTDLIATEPERDTRVHILGLGATIYLAIHIKLYGAVLGVACPVYLAMHARQLLARSTHRGSKLIVLAVVFVALAGVLLTAKWNLNPLLELTDEGGLGDYVSSIADVRTRAVQDAVSMFAFALLLIFQAALLFLVTRAAWRAWAAAPAVFVAIYLLGLLTFSGTIYNMRYFLPALPFLVLPLAAGAQSVRPITRHVILAAYGAIGAVLVLSFNWAPAEQLLDPLLSQATAQDRSLRFWLDNLRLPAQIKARKRLDVINAQVPLGGTLYWASDYYGTATHGLAEPLGIKPGLAIRYVMRASDIPRSTEPVFVMQFGSNGPVDPLREAPPWATVTRLGEGTFRLDSRAPETHPN